MKVQDLAAAIGAGGCLFFCYLYCSGAYTSESDALKKAAEAIENGTIEKDCTVSHPERIFYENAGRRVRILRKKISSLDEIKEKTPVNFVNGNFNHWVVVENGKVVFNSIEKSVCVAKGKPTEARIIEYV